MNDSNNSISRRAAMMQAGALSISAVAVAGWGEDREPDRRTAMGIVMYDCGLRRQWMQKQRDGIDLFSPLIFMQHCHSLGAGGAQVALRDLAPEDCQVLRRFVSDHDLYLETIVSPPKDRDDLRRFDAEMRAARDAGALAARTVIIPGRRYEYFETYESFKESARRGHAMVEMALPVVEKYGVPLAIENHKDERIDDRVQWLRRIDHPLVGACVDTGNSLSLLDDIYGTIEALAPFAHSVHFKDQALKEYPDGYLLGDVPLGQGSFDLNRIIEILRKKKPDIRFSLEVITRDALKIPCLTKDYWEVVRDAGGLDLARTLQFVRHHQAEPIRISGMPLDQQVRREDANIMASLAFAGRELRI